MQTTGAKLALLLGNGVWKMRATRGYALRFADTLESTTCTAGSACNGNRAAATKAPTTENGFGFLQRALNHNATFLIYEPAC